MMVRRHQRKSGEEAPEERKSGYRFHGRDTNDVFENDVVDYVSRLSDHCYSKDVMPHEAG
jgi:hypothetical protein